MSEASQIAEPLIVVRDASKIYRDGQVQALAHVSLSIAAGEFLASRLC